MNSITKNLLPIGVSILSICQTTLSAYGQQIWVGKGEIIEGVNQGALVELKLETDNGGNNAIIQSNPSPNQKIPLKKRTQTMIGTWEIYPCNGYLCATLEQNNPYRIIYYRLQKQYQ